MIHHGFLGPNKNYLISAGLGGIVLFFVEVYHYNHKTGDLRKSIRRLPAAARGILYVLAGLMILLAGTFGKAFIYFDF